MLIVPRRGGAILFSATLAPVIAPFPWGSLPKVDRRTSRWVTALAGWLPRAVREPGGGFVIRRGAGGLEVARAARGVHLAADLGVDAIRVARAEVLAGDALVDRLADPTAGVARVRAGGVRGFVVAPGDVVRAIAQAILGGPDELGAPRPLTLAEQAVLVVATAALVDDLGLAVEV